MGNPKGQSTSTTSSSPPGPVMNDYYSAIDRAQQVASTPYQQYQGNLVQGFSPDQLAAFNSVNNAQGSFQGDINQAQQYATLGATPIQASAIANYSNPYQQQVINATLGNINETNQQQQAQLLSNNLGNGGLFNDRLGVAQAELARQQGLANNQTLAGLNQSNYTQALTAAQADRGAAGQAAYTFGNLGTTNLQDILSASQAQLGTGGLQQQLGQAQLNVPYMQFQQAQAFPYQQTAWLTGQETGIGSNLGGNSTTVGTPAQPNPYAQYAGLGIAGLGAAGNLGWAPLATAAVKRGGRIHGYADGGAPDGMSVPFGSAVPGIGGPQSPAVPYGGSMTYIPGGSQITRGSGPPGAPKSAGAPAAAPQDPFAADIKALGSLGSHFKQPASLGDSGIMTGGASLELTPDEYAAASASGVSSLGSPDEGFYARGGPIKGDRRGIYLPRWRGGFAEGGMPDLGNQELGPWGSIGPDPGVFTPPMSLGDAPSPGPAAAPWGDLASDPIDATSFAQPSWAGSVGASVAPSGPTGFPAGSFASQETGTGFDVPSWDAGQSASLGTAARSWPADATTAGAGMAPPIEDKGTVGPGPGGASSVPAIVSSAWRGQGASDNAVKGILYNVNAESGFNPALRHPDQPRFGGEAHYAHGLYQEGGEEWNRFRGWMQQTHPGSDWRDPALQSEFAAWNLKNNYPSTWEKMNNAPTWQDAAAIYAREYLKPAAQNLNSRVADIYGRKEPLRPGEGEGITARGAGDRSLGDQAALPPTARTAEANLGTPTHRGGLGSPEFNNALMAAGFSLMANKSPWLGQAVGNAGLAGIGTYTEAVRHGEATERQERKEAREEKKVDLQQSRVDAAMKRLEAQHEAAVAATDARTKAAETAARKQDEAERHNREAEDRQRQLLQKQLESGKYTAQPGTRKNPETGEDETGTVVMNTTTGQTEFRPSYTLTAKAKPGAVALPAEAWKTQGEDFLKYLPPDKQQLVKGVANYTVDPKTLSVIGGHREDVLNWTKQYDPGFDQRRYNETFSAVNKFATGKQGDTVRSLNVSIDHLETLQAASEALKNGNVQLFNRIGNRISSELGLPAVTNFEGVRDIVADEIVKAVLGSSGSAEDRANLRHTINAANSPAQLNGVIEQYQHLMAGQMRGLRKQYEDSTGLKNFNDKLNPGTLQRLERLDSGAAMPPEGSRKQFKQGWGIVRGGQWVPAPAGP